MLLVLVLLDFCGGQDILLVLLKSEFQRRMSYLGFVHDKLGLCTKSDMPVTATHHSLASASHGVTENQMRASVSQPMPISPTGNMLVSSLNSGLHSTSEIHVQNTKVRTDIRSQSQLLSRYCPKMSDLEMQQMSGDSNTYISPLFEKMLSPSDAGRVGRLVLPKKCAMVTVYEEVKLEKGAYIAVVGYQENFTS